MLESARQGRGARRPDGVVSQLQAGKSPVARQSVGEGARAVGPDAVAAEVERAKRPVSLERFGNQLRARVSQLVHVEVELPQGPIGEELGQGRGPFRSQRVVPKVDDSDAAATGGGRGGGATALALCRQRFFPAGGERLADRSDPFVPELVRPRPQLHQRLVLPQGRGKRQRPGCSVVVVGEVEDFQGRRGSQGVGERRGAVGVDGVARELEPLQRGVCLEGFRDRRCAGVA